MVQIKNKLNDIEFKSISIWLHSSYCYILHDETSIVYIQTVMSRYFFFFVIEYYTKEIQINFWLYILCKCSMTIETVTTRGSSYKHLSSNFFFILLSFCRDWLRKGECVAPVHWYGEEEKKKFNVMKMSMEEEEDYQCITLISFVRQWGRKRAMPLLEILKRKLNKMTYLISSVHL